MGCDIHVSLEHKPFVCSEKHDFFGSPYIPRDYTLFSVMANVRTQGDGVALYTPKGLPNNLSYETLKAIGYPVIDNMSVEESTILKKLEINTVTSDNVTKWKSKTYTIANKLYAESPDYHSHSWLTLSQLKKVINKCESIRSEPTDSIDTIKAIVAAMEYIKEPRLVFWFDN